MQGMSSTLKYISFLLFYKWYLNKQLNGIVCERPKINVNNYSGLIEIKKKKKSFYENMFDLCGK